MSDASENALRSASAAQSVVALGVALALATACSERFTGVDDPPVAGAAGSSGSAGTKASGGSSATAGGKSGGAGGRGGASPSLGGDSGDGGELIDPGLGGSAGLGGLPPIGGVAGEGGVPEPVPISEEGLELWLRADQGVVLDGGVVASWQDSSQHQRNAGQTAGNYRPKLTENGLGNLRAVVFDGEDDYLKLPPLDADFSGGVSVFAMTYQGAAAECEAIFEACNGREVDDLHLGSWKASSLYEVGANYAHAIDYPIVFDQPQLLAAVHQANGLVRLRRNSNGLIEGMFELSPVVTRNEVFIGRTLYQGCAPFSGAVAELLVYSRAVSDDELVEIETYLQKKWGCCTE
jgi:hypothetical protein